MTQNKHRGDEEKEEEQKIRGSSHMELSGGEMNM